MNKLKQLLADLKFEHVDQLLLIIITIVVAFILSILLRKVAHVIIKKYSERIKVDPTNYSFLKNSLSFIIFSVALFFIFTKIPYLKSLGTAMFAGAGILAAIIGFASQKAFSNIISGVFILIFKPLRVGDTIAFSNFKGIVEEITLRHTIIRDYENRRIVIPNSNISDEIIINSNIADERIRKHIEFGISYDSNIDKAIDIIQKEAGNHPLVIDGRSNEEIKAGEPKILVRVIGHEDFSIKLKAYVWCHGNDNSFIIYCDLLKSVKEQFDKNGIEIPFPYRTIVYKNDIPKKS